MIIDEADRMLDMGFEKEMTACLEEIKKRVPQKFTTEPGLFHSETIRMQLVSATLNPKVESLGNSLMKDYHKVGFTLESADQYQASLPAQV